MRFIFNFLTFLLLMINGVLPILCLWFMLHYRASGNMVRNTSMRCLSLWLPFSLEIDSKNSEHSPMKFWLESDNTQGTRASIIWRPASTQGLFWFSTSLALQNANIKWIVLCDGYSTECQMISHNFTSYPSFLQQGIVSAIEKYDCILFIIVFIWKNTYVCHHVLIVY